MSENMIEKLMKLMSEKTAATYIALGMRPGEGGKFGPYLAGYEAAMADVRAMISKAKEQTE